MRTETIRKSILAGMLIAIAAMFSMSVAEYGPLVQGLCFSVGLFGILCSDAALFTGRMLSVRYVLNNEIKVRKMLGEWLVVLACNFVGVLVTCLLAYAIGFDASKIAVGKASMTSEGIFVRAIFCNVMVCLAVFAGRWAKGATDKFLACLMPVACFVACGFEHSVADMFYMILGLFNGAVDVMDVLHVLVVAVVGNIVGGTVYAVLGYERRN